MSAAALEIQPSRPEPAGAAPGRARRPLARAFRLVLVLATLVLAGPSVVYIRQTLETERAVYKDFGQEYLLASAIAHGVDPYLPIRELAARYLTAGGLLVKPFPTPHPPSVGVLFLPFLLTDYVTAVRIWFGVQVISLVAAIGLVIRQVGAPFTLRSAPILAFAAVAWMPVVIELGLGQLTLALLLLISAANFALAHDHECLSVDAGVPRQLSRGSARRGSVVSGARHTPGCRKRDVLGGALLGLSLLLKPLAWPLLLPLVMRRRWSSVCAAGIVVVFGFVLPSLKIGLEPVSEYLTSVLPSVSAQYATETTNVSLWTVGPRLFRGVESGPLAGTSPLLSSPEAARLVGAAIPSAVLVLAITWLRTRPPLPIAFGVMICVSILVNPISWEYYLVLLLLPVSQLLHLLHVYRFPRVPTLLTGLVGIALYPDRGTWRDLAQLASGPWTGFDQPLAPIPALLTLGPSLSVGGLGILVAWLSGDAVRTMWRSSVTAFKTPPVLLSAKRGRHRGSSRLMLARPPWCASAPLPLRLLRNIAAWNSPPAGTSRSSAVLARIDNGLLCAHLRGRPEGNSAGCPGGPR